MVGDVSDGVKGSTSEYDVMVGDVSDDGEGWKSHSLYDVIFHNK